MMQKIEITQIASTAAGELVAAVETVLAALKGDSGGRDAKTLFEGLAYYAWSGITDEDPNWIEDLLHEACVPVELLRGNLMDPTGTNLMTTDAIGFINRLVNAAHARKAIDDGGRVTIEWLAALANVSERTIRSATNASNPNAMPIIKEGHWTFIDASHALQWISRRNDFAPTQVPNNGPRSSELHRALQLGEVWQKWRENQNLTIDDLAAALGWSGKQVALYARIESGNLGDDSLVLSPQFWRELAVHLGSKEPDDVAATTYRSLAAAYANWRLKSDLPPRH
ncbi:helix-turn-helix domain-containing protein [Rhodanobacter thiooxydans]|nr:helix-turn-helix transcriptional regulator [Rhodanobacter thiooxydans]EIL97313.1 hypothetical protein UUA_15298 [Rhodanobacter thiooxydans LCS2]MCW0202859.1 helix-turn-helix domain-containing protein [Rhodanobacter thiooxydans]